MKKKVLLFLMMVFSGIVFSEKWVSLGEICFQCPDNVELDFKTPNESFEYNSFPMETKARGNNRLIVRVLSFAEYQQFEKDSWHLVKKYADYEDFKQTSLKTNTWIGEGPSETCIQQVYEDKGMLFGTNYSFTSLWYVDEIGSYDIAVFGNNKIYLLQLIFNKINGGTDDKILKKLDKLIHPVYKGMKLGDGPGEQREGWMFNEGKDVNDLYKAIKEKNTGAKEINEFQQQYEIILNSITSNMMTKTLDNVRIRKNTSLDSESLVTVKKGEKIIIINRVRSLPETIDGITGYWYEVTVPKGTLDKDGKPTKAEVKGFCFGGYLER